MEVHIAPGLPARLAQAEDLRRFSVIAADGPDALPDLAAALQGVFVFEGTGHAWVAVDWLLSASGQAESEAWRPGFEAMRAYAAKQGWMRDDPPALRGHVVRQVGSPA